MSNYEDTLKTARTIGAKRCSDVQALALYCDGPLQYVAGAVSPALVFDGAVKSGLTLLEVSKLTPLEVGDLMWL